MAAPSMTMRMPLFTLLKKANSLHGCVYALSAGTRIADRFRDVGVQKPALDRGEDTDMFVAGNVSAVQSVI